MLAEPKVVCLRRKSNPRCDLGIYFAVCYGCVAVCVGLDAQSRVVLLPGLWSCMFCVYLLSLRLYLVGVRLHQVVCALDVCCPSIGLCAFDINRTEMRSRYILFCVVRLCCPVRGPRRAVPGCAPAGTMCARRVLAEPRVVGFRRKPNTGCDPGIYFSVWYGCAALYVGLYVKSRIVMLLPGLCALDVCGPSLRLCAFT